MSNCRRNRVPGGTYFFTVNLLDRQSGLLVSHIGELRAAVRQTKRLHPFHIDAWVVLPNHLHCVWTLPENDADYSRRWQAIKKSFSKSIPLTAQRTKVQTQRNEWGIWQRRFWEYTITDDRDYAAHIDYIHFNRSSTAGCGQSRIGLIQRFISGLKKGFIRQTGQRVMRRQRIPESRRVDKRSAIHRFIVYAHYYGGCRCAYPPYVINCNRNNTDNANNNLGFRIASTPATWPEPDHSRIIRVRCGHPYAASPGRSALPAKECAVFGRRQPVIRLPLFITAARFDGLPGNLCRKPGNR